MGELAVDKHVQYILSVEKKLILAHTGGFAGNVGHDPRILYTLSAVQVLALFNKLDVLDIDKNEDGSFYEDMWDEVDMQFSYIAIRCLSMLHCFDKIDVEKAINYILSSWIAALDVHLVASLMQVKDLCIILIRTFLGGGYESGKSNMEVLVAASRNSLMMWKMVEISDRPDDTVDVFLTYIGVADQTGIHVSL
ncbi:hypothetical protein DITRI_Ditri01bG0110400 [Diplodiscus trichospermus]